MRTNFWYRNASTVLTCLGGVGLIATTVLAIKATPKALQLLEEEKEKKREDLTTWETVKTTGITYLPTVITGTATLACIFGANALNKRQQASLMSTYALLDSSYKKYRRKVVELYGEETHKEIVDAIAVEEAKEVYMHTSNLGVDCTQFLEEDYSGEVGWVIEDEGSFWIDFHHRKVELDDGLECYIIEMLFEPTMEWKEYYY